MFEVKKKERFASIKYGSEVVRIPVRAIGPGLSLKLADQMDEIEAMFQVVREQQTNLEDYAQKVQSGELRVDAEYERSSKEQIQKLNIAFVRKMIELLKVCIVNYEKYDYIIESLDTQDINGFMTAIIQAMQSDDTEGQKKNGTQGSMRSMQNSRSRKPATRKKRR